MSSDTDAEFQARRHRAIRGHRPHQHPCRECGQPWECVAACTWTLTREDAMAQGEPIVCPVCKDSLGHTVRTGSTRAPAALQRLAKELRDLTAASTATIASYEALTEKPAAPQVERNVQRWMDEWDPLGE